MRFGYLGGFVLCGGIQDVHYSNVRFRFVVYCWFLVGSLQPKNVLFLCDKHKRRSDDDSRNQEHGQGRQEVGDGYAAAGRRL